MIPLLYLRQVPHIDCVLSECANLFIADEKLILMTSTFDVVSETTLHPSDFGEGE